MPADDLTISAMETSTFSSMDNETLSTIAMDTSTCHYDHEDNGDKILSSHYSVKVMSVSGFMIILMLSGIVDNALVIFVFWFKRNKTIANYFMLILASVDFFSCLTIHPYVTFKLYHFYQTTVAVCKIFEFLIHFTLATQTGILFAVAVDRYYGVCKPLKFISSYNRAVLLMGNAFGLSFIVSVPLLEFYGARTVYVTFEGCTVMTSVCHYSNAYDGTMAQAILGAVVLLILVFVLVSISLIYIMIAIDVRKRRRRIKPFGLHDLTDSPPVQPNSKKNTPLSTSNSNKPASNPQTTQLQTISVTISQQAVNNISVTNTNHQETLPVIYDSFDSDQESQNAGNNTKNNSGADSNSHSNSDDKDVRHSNFVGIQSGLHEDTVTPGEQASGLDSSIARKSHLIQRLQMKESDVEKQRNDVTNQDHDTGGTLSAACNTNNLLANDNISDITPGKCDCSKLIDRPEVQIVPDQIVADLLDQVSRVHTVHCHYHQGRISNKVKGSSSGERSNTLVDHKLGQYEIQKEMKLGSRNDVTKATQSQIGDDGDVSHVVHNNQDCAASATSSSKVERTHQEVSETQVDREVDRSHCMLQQRMSEKIITFQEDVTFKSRSLTSAKAKPKAPKQPPKRFESLKGTKMLFVVTTLFFLSWLPFWVLKISDIGSPGLWANHSTSGEVLYAFLNHLYFINNAINPVIYTFANSNFREDCRTVFTRIRWRIVF